MQRASLSAILPASVGAPIAAGVPTAGVPVAARTRRTEASSRWGRWRWQLYSPACLTSLVLHAVLMLLLGYTAWLDLRGTNAPEGAELVASFSTDSVDGEYYEDELANEVTLAEESQEVPATGDDAAGGEALAAVFNGPPPVDASSALPAAAEATSLTAGEPGQSIGAGDFTGAGRKPVKVEGGKARTKVYGIVGEGHKFVYVFDRSGSMGGGGGSPLNSAKKELLASLENLGDLHQFQIIFYNENPTLMQLGRRPGALVFADEQTKRLAGSFVGGIVADGGTRHENALELALKLRPDVVFFLTDADQPELSPGQLDKIRRSNGGACSINTIEFGLGPSMRRDNFLVQLARQNGGQHVYIDISKRGSLH